MIIRQTRNPGNHFVDYCILGKINYVVPIYFTEQLSE